MNFLNYYDGVKVKRIASVLCGASLVAMFFGWTIVRDHSSLSVHFPIDESLRFVVNLIAWGVLLGGVSLIASACLTRRQVQADE